MKSYRLTSIAEEDLFEIWAYIAADNVEAADSVETEIFEACRSLADQPHLGHFRRDLTKKAVRFFPVRGTFLIIYDPVPEPLEIIRILHGARDVASELES